MTQPTMTTESNDRWGAKTSSQEQGPSFDLVETSQTVVVREIQEAKHTTCWLDSSPVGCIPIQITAALGYE
jgi:hypothetical protein